MDMKTFRRKMDAYGADFSRWGGGGAEEAQAFMESSADAQALYSAALKLDAALGTYRVSPPGDSVMGAVESRIGGVGLQENGAGNVKPFPLRIETSAWKVALGIGLAAAAVLVLLSPSVGVIEGKRIVPLPVEGDGSAQVDAFVAEMASIMEEDDRAGEIFGLLEVAQASPAQIQTTVMEEGAAASSEVDSFLDELFEADEEQMIDSSRTAAPDIWDIFYPSAGKSP